MLYYEYKKEVDRMKLDGMVAVITGGAMGNGLGIVKTFLKYGAKVVIIDSSEEIRNTLQKLQIKYPHGYAAGCICDIRDKERLDSIMKTIYSQLGKIDVLVNNAGVCKLSSFEDTTDELRDFHFDINIKGTWNVTKSALPYLNSPASIINLSSVTGVRVADPGEVAYATTKAALVGFTKGLAADLVSKNIRVNAVLPGYIRTPMVEGMAKESDKENPEHVIKNIADAIPMKRMGTPEELGELCAFLACNESSYITAETIIFDGGSTLPETNSMGV